MSFKFKFVESPDRPIVRVYANSVCTAKTPYDLRLTFGEVTGVEDSTIMVENRAVATMSWSKIKVLINTLTAEVAAFEAINGEIQIPSLSKTEEGTVN